MANLYQYDQIDEVGKQFAMKCLGENPSKVNAHIESLRRWVKSMPHLQCPTDGSFLLRFLRVSKFDHVKAQKKLDNFCTVRTSERGSSWYFRIYDVNDEAVDIFLKMRYLIPLGKVNSGELILLHRYSGWDPDLLPADAFISMFFMSLDVVLSQEEAQIFGVKFLLDLHGISRKTLENVCDPKLLKKCYTALQDAYPLRFKGQIFCSDSSLFDVFFNIVFFFLNDKMKSRTSRLKNNIAKAAEMTPGLEKILPKEYNGLGGTLDECAERWNEQFKRFYKHGHPLKNVLVDESKRPAETVNYLAEYEDYKGETFQTSGIMKNFESF